MSKFKRISAVLLVFVLTLGMGVSTLAANPALIDPGQKGSITIHKFDSTGSATGIGDNGDGTEISNTTGFGNPLPGIAFKATLLAGATSTTTVSQAEEIVSAMSAAELALNQKSGTTNASGVYAFSNLDQGIYLVQEVASAAVTGTVESFLVSIPMTDPVDNSSWLYDIHVYPKNTEADAAITKTIRTSDGDVMEKKADVGDEVVWAITPSIPAGIGAIDLSVPTGYYFITDTLDARLDYVSTVVRLVDSAGAVVATLQSGTHYTLTQPTVGAAGGNIKVDFNRQAGIDRLLVAKADGHKLEVVITTTINETAVTNLTTAISNSAELYYDNEGDPDDPEPPITPPDDPEVELTGLALYKYWMDNTTKTHLNEAVFTIYETSVNAGNNTAMELSGTTWTKTTGVTPIITGGVARNGYIYFSQADLMTALGYDPASAADIAAFETAHPAFFLLETTAPSGFNLLNEIVRVPLGTTAEAENVKSPNFELPITGGSGTLLFTIIGIILIGGGATLLFVFRKKKKMVLK